MLFRSVLEVKGEIAELGDTINGMIDHARATPPGAFVEVGVYKGGTAWHLAEIARAQGRTLWLFDTFTGIPERTDGLDTHQIGDFRDTNVESVRAAIPDAQIVVGDARESVESTDTGPIAFAHLDCDQYDTYRKVLAAIVPRMVIGGAIEFDDYESLEGARKAVDEFFGVSPHGLGGRVKRF